MLQNVEDTRVKKRLCLVLPRQNRETYRKYVTFFVYCFFLFFGSNIVKVSAAAPDISGERDRKIIIVSAVVPLTEDFSYLIRKNSTITLQKKAFVAGETGRVRVTIRGGKGALLGDHQVILRIFNTHKEEKVSFSGKTDVLGAVDFAVYFTEQLLGENRMQVVDMTYGESLSLMEEPYFIVYETQDAKEKSEKNMVRGVASAELTDGGVFLSKASQGEDDFSGKSATIRVYRPVEELSRSGSP